MKGKIIKIDKEWKVEIQSDLHGYGIGWGDPIIYPLFITDENIWEGKEVEVEPIQYDSNFIPVIVKIKTNNTEDKEYIIDTISKITLKEMEEAAKTIGLTMEESCRFSDGAEWFQKKLIEVVRESKSNIKGGTMGINGKSMYDYPSGTMGQNWDPNI